MLDAAINVPAGLPSVGELVGGKYLLERYFAEGGMGIIALGRHVELDEPVAIKFLKPDVVAADASGTLASRFVREARATIKIRSEHVPRIFDVTTLDAGVPYIVMELLVGEDLDKRLERDGPLPITFVVDLLLQSLEALAAAHALGMVHRDLKPANLFVATRLDGTTCVKVLDFGIAKLVDRTGAGIDTGLTDSHAAMGSPRYMSPEQMRSARDVDGRADIWAVGTTLYELLVGAPPFDGETLTQVCAAILQDEPGSIRQRRPEVPAALEAVILRCLAKKPGDRQGDVAELAAALAPFGTAPLADELALRAARVLGVAASPSPSSPSLTAARVIPASSGTPVARELANIGSTSTSWDAARVAVPSGRRRTRTLATVLGIGFALGIAMGGVAFFRARTAAKAAASASISSVAAAPASAAPPDTGPAHEPAPSVTPVAVPPVSVGAVATAVASGTKPPSNANANTAAKPVSKPVSPPTSPNKPTASPPAGGLWDDRK